MAIRDTLRDLFSRKLVLKRYPGNKLKLVDIDHVQATGNELTKYSRYKRLRKSYNNSGWSTINSTQEQIETARMQMYIDYELMDTDAILAGALDVYADECTTKNPQGDLLTINTENATIKKILHNLFYDVLNIEFNLWHWVRGLCKNGDLFLLHDIQPGVGVVDALPVHPSLMRRRDDHGEDMRTVYVYEGEGYTQINRSLFERYEVSHFRLISDTNYLPYGKSMVEGARKTFKQLLLMEDAMLLHRIMRAPERRVFKVDVGLIPPEEVDSHIEEIIEANKKTPHMGEDGQYNLRYNLANMMEDYYLPVRGGKSGTEISTLDGLRNDGAIEDIEYIRNKMMAYLKIPKAYLGYDADVEGKSVLAAEDIRFARTIERVQKIVVGELYKLAYVHLYTQGFKDEDMLDFTMTLTSPSMIYERQKIDMMNEKMTLVTSMMESKLFSRQYIYENIFSLSSEEWKAEQDQVLEDLKRAFQELQISEEGNDPLITGKSYGTPHDLAMAAWTAGQENEEGGNNSSGNSADVKKLYAKDGREENEGRPKKNNKFGRKQDDVHGEDPTGSKTLQRDLKIKKEAAQALKGIPANYIKGTSVQQSLLSEIAQNMPEIKMLSEESLILEDSGNI